MDKKAIKCHLIVKKCLDTTGKEDDFFETRQWKTCLEKEVADALAYKFSKKEKHIERWCMSSEFMFFSLVVLPY